MSKVIIKSVRRKTTISKAAIKKAAKLAYAMPKKQSATKASKKINRAA